MKNKKCYFINLFEFPLFLIEQNTFTIISINIIEFLCLYYFFVTVKGYIFLQKNHFDLMLSLAH